MKKHLKGIDLGSVCFTEAVVVSDPCYTTGTFGLGSLRVVKPGRWNVVSWKAENPWDGHMLVVTHVDYKNFIFPKEILGRILGIDSGQVGVYDAQEYRNDDMVENLKKQKTTTPIGILTDDVWYSYACHICSKIPAKLVGNGVTSQSGYGDGVAELLIDKNTKGEIIRIGINF